jgi:hypothetical protein
MGIAGLVLTNSGDSDGWQIVVIVFVAAPILLGLALRFWDSHRE